jgi:hypothetical protein
MKGSRMQKAIGPGVLAALLLLIASALASARSGPARIVNGRNSQAFPTTGALLYSGGGQINENNALSWCSGTLIGCETFLTAAHCVENDSDASHYWVYFQHAGIHSIRSLASHPSYVSLGFPEFDVAVMKLGSAVTGIQPTPINTIASPSFGTSGTIVGFGQSSGGAGDFGIKRFGHVETSDCTGVVSSLGNSELVCWRFQNPVGPPGDDSNTCNGDSGGPLFVDFGSGEVVAGVTSGGGSGNCLPIDDSYDANIFTYSGFVLNNLGSDSTTTCGGIPPVGNSLVDVIGNQGTLSSSNASDTFTISVPSKKNEVRFAMHGETSARLDVNFSVKEGLGASSSSFDCKADGSRNFGDCTFVLPNGGDWSMFVERASGSGEYQFTTTVFGGDPPVCGNETKEPGEDCDGTDDGACPGLCEVDCMCPAPVCGNSVTEMGEQCDGSDDDACPGLCQTECACFVPCNTGDLFVVKAKSNAKRFVVRTELANFFGVYDGLDPRQEFRLVVRQAGDEVNVQIPALDPGWIKSKPEKGRYLWKGELSGIRRVKLLDQTFKKGVWKVEVRGKAVPGAGGIDLRDPTLINLQLTTDGVCTETSF